MEGICVSEYISVPIKQVREEFSGHEPDTDADNHCTSRGDPRLDTFVNPPRSNHSESWHLS
jgi:hypothetical protein